MLANGTLGESYDDSTWIDPYLSTPDTLPEAAPEIGQLAAPLPVEPEPPLDHREALLELCQLVDPGFDPGDDPEAWHLPPPGIHTTGTQLRRRLVTPESIAELAETRRPGLLGRLLGRK